MVEKEREEERDKGRIEREDLIRDVGSVRESGERERKFDS